MVKDCRCKRTAVSYSPDENSVRKMNGIHLVAKDHSTCLQIIGEEHMIGSPIMYSVPA